jgi:hypothetical protein
VLRHSSRTLIFIKAGCRIQKRLPALFCLMPSHKTTNWSVSPHAKQRAWERYGVVFSPQKWADFCQTLWNGKHSIRLGSDGSGSCRFACYFQKRWFLVGCSVHGRSGIVSTFLPVAALSDTDKTILQSNDLYCRFGNDPWDIVHQKLPGRLDARQRTRLPEIPILPEELPPDFNLVGELLEKHSQESIS